MSRSIRETPRFLLGAFGDDHSALAAAEAARAQGLEVVDVYGPYPIHGIEEAMGWRESRLGILCFLLGAAGLGVALLFQYWTSAVDWPINVGGKPFNSLPAFIPVAFEITVLFAGVGTVIALFLRSRLYPGRRPQIVDSRATDDRFVVCVAESTRAADVSTMRALWSRFGVESIEERVESPDVRPANADRRQADRPILVSKSAIVATVACAMLAVFVLTRAGTFDDATRGIEFAPDMVRSPAIQAFESDGLGRDGVSSSIQIPGTVARGYPTFPYDATPEGLKRAGEDLRSPLVGDLPADIDRGAFVFKSICAACHGATGRGDGVVTKRGVPPPPSLLLENARKIKDGEIYAIITVGRLNMPPHAAQIERLDRWRVIRFIRKLQEDAK